MSPVAPTTVADQPVRGATGVVNTECSALASTIKVIDWPPTSLISWAPEGLGSGSWAFPTLILLQPEGFARPA